MNGFSILMFIFGICVLLVGLYMFNGHKIGMLAWRAPFIGVDKDGWKKIGKYTMIASIIIFLLAIIGLVFNI